MESPDLNRSTPEDAQLEALLRRALSAPLPDDGFSARVLAALPNPQAQSAVFWRRLVVCAVGAAAGSGLALWNGASWQQLRSSFGQFAAAFANSGPALVTPLFAAALLVSAWSLLFAFKAELRDKLLR